MSVATPARNRYFSQPVTPRTSLTKRIAAAFLAATFLFAVHASATGSRPCPHHDRLPQGHTAHASHMAAGAGHASQSGEHHDGACTCLTGAQCGAPVALHATPTIAFVTPTVVTPLPVGRLAHQAPARSPTLYLPEATAPPAVL